MAILAALNTASITVEPAVSLTANDPRKIMEAPMTGSMDKSHLPNEGNVTSVILGEKIRLDIGHFTGNTIWFHCLCDLGLDANDDAVFQFEDPDGNGVFRLELDAGTSSVSPRINGTADGLSSITVPSQLDFEFTNGDVVRAYANGALVGTSLTPISWTTLRTVDLNTDFLKIGEVIVADTNTRNLCMVTLDATAVGSQDAFAADPTMISGQVLTDDQITAESEGVQTFTFEALPSDLDDRGLKPHAVFMGSIASSLDSSPSPFVQHVTYKDGILRDLGTPAGLGPASHFNPVTSLDYTNPVTNQPWKLADFTGIEFGFRTVPSDFEVTFTDNSGVWQYGSGFGTLESGDATFGTGVIAALSIDSAGLVQFSGSNSERYENSDNLALYVVLGSQRWTIDLTYDSVNNLYASANATVGLELFAAITALPGGKLKVIAKGV